MPRPNVHVAAVKSIDPASAKLGIAPRSVSVTLENGVTAHLDASDRRTPVWHSLLESVRDREDPIYLEVDPSSHIITRLLLSQVLRVEQISEPNAHGDVSVSFDKSAALHYVRHAEPNFEELVRELKQALETKSELAVTDAVDGPNIVDVRPLPKGFVRKEMGTARSARPSGKRGLVDFARAKALFDSIVTRTCHPASIVDPCIPFLYPDDGCWARADEMCHILVAAGESPRKVWIRGNLRVHSANKPVTSYSPACIVEWAWHVAPTLQVSGAGSETTYVIDPSLFDEPVPLSSWQAVQDDLHSTLTETDMNVYIGGAAEQPGQLAADLQRYRDRLRIRVTSIGAPPYPCPDCYVRDNLSDSGAEPLAGGGISSSPDIHHFRDPLEDPMATLATPAALGRDDLFEPIEYGQPNYLYVRIQNRGTLAVPATVALYYSNGSTLPTPNGWQFIGEYTTPAPVNPGQVTIAGPIVWDSVPTQGHYCFVAIVTTEMDVTPNRNSVRSMDDFYRLIRQSNNVTWKNFEVVDVIPGSRSLFEFVIQGWPRQGCRSDLEVNLGQLPRGAKAQLKVLRRLTVGAAVQGMTPGEASELFAVYDIPDQAVAALRGMPLRSSDHSQASVIIDVPEATPSGAYQFSVRQLVDGKEMGRISRRLLVGHYPYIGNSSTLELHVANCAWVQKMSPSHRVAYREVPLALARGFNGCHDCLSEYDSG